MLISIIGNASIMNGRKRIRCPARSAIPATIRFALAPTSEPFPPRHAPSASDHHSGISPSGPPKLGAIDLISGIIVATNGMLSTTAEATAEIHMMASAVTARSPPVVSRTHPARMASTPACSMPCTTMNRPMKKKIVTHSTSPNLRWTLSDCASAFLPTFVTSSRSAAPNIAMVAGSSRSGWANRKATITSPSTARDFFSNGTSVIASRSLKRMMCARRSSVACIPRP